MDTKDEAEFKAKYPKLYAFAVNTAQEDGTDLTKHPFTQLEMYDEEYAEIQFGEYVIGVQGSEDGSFGEWSLESSGPLNLS
jgi:hypothetical protein